MALSKTDTDVIWEHVKATRGDELGTRADVERLADVFYGQFGITNPSEISECLTGLTIHRKLA